jgi:hypothetical protein
MRRNVYPDPGIPFDSYGGLTRSQWAALEPHEQRDVLLKTVKEKEVAAQEEFEAATHVCRTKLQRIQVPSSAAAEAARLRSLLMPPVDRSSSSANFQASGGRLTYVNYYFRSTGPDIEAVNAATRAIETSTKAQEKFAKAQQDLKLVADEFHDATVKQAKKMVALEMEKREILQKYPQEGEPSFTRYKGRLLTEGELESVKAFEQEHASPRAAADSYVLLLTSLRVWNPVYSGTYPHKYRGDVVAVYYLTEKPDTRRVYVATCKTSEGLWFVCPRAGQRDNLVTGKPPLIFENPMETKQND